MSRVVDWGEKPPLANLNYAWDLTSWIALLPAGDAIASVALLDVSPSDLTVSTPNFSLPPLVIVTASGGTHGSRYSIPIQVTSVSGLIDEFVALLAVLDPEIEVAGQIGAGQVG